MNGIGHKRQRAPKRRTVIEYFERALQRSGRPQLPLIGPLERGPGGLAVCFSLNLVAGRIRGAEFKATTCTTLLAYCELLAELIMGLTPTEARRLDTGRLIDGLPGVPPTLHNRAGLPIAALTSALAQHSAEESK